MSTHVQDSNFINNKCKHQSYIYKPSFNIIFIKKFIIYNNFK
jgi:hypothetical protein